ncbi:hypothetical protein RMATCC62417_03829 [Rhizopus microsporus]|nr:hypothetical protein RMATCC62417_03829 [Rhizopus microsporus]
MGQHCAQSAKDSCGSWIHRFVDRTPHWKGSEFEPLTEEQVGVAMIGILKSEMDVIAPWISFVTSRKQFDPELEEDEQMYKEIELKPQQA